MFQAQLICIQFEPGGIITNCITLLLIITFLFDWQCKGDFQGAEDYYSRAALADPANGEILSQYAKLVWDLHHDHDKALGYYEQAVEATPADWYGFFQNHLVCIILCITITFKFI